MRERLAIILSFLLVAIPLAAQSTSSKTEPAQVVSNAEIIKIDAKKKRLQVRELVDLSAGSPTGGRRGGGGGGGRGRSSGGGRRGGGGRGGGGGGFPGGGGGTPRVQAKEYKVFVGTDTVMKIQDTNLEFSDLHVGDRIFVTGTPKGTKGDIDATTISRDLR